MELLIALFLTIVLSACVCHDKSKSAKARRNWEQSQKEYNNWKSCYCDRALEETLNRFIVDSSNQLLIKEELSPIFSALSSGNSLLSDDFLKGFNRTLDLMLANRGKVSNWAASFGYSTGYGKAEGMQCFEFAEILMKLLAYRGVKLELIYKSQPGRSSAYYWAGSPGSRVFSDSEILPFDREIIFKKTTIPIVKFP